MEVRDCTSLLFAGKGQSCLKCMQEHERAQRANTDFCPCMKRKSWERGGCKTNLSFMLFSASKAIHKVKEIWYQDWTCSVFLKSKGCIFESKLVPAATCRSPQCQQHEAIRVTRSFQ